ncbi:MAG: nicotinate-nucleotide adenylyltransferase [Tenacibaculum sp.]|nr:nicotinate-nucleotide adenylyltransferase [Tenacibaculum sp.]
MKNIGLYFGTFNPIHVGHLIIANHLVENSDLDEVWLVVTPHNPHKKKTSLLHSFDRIEMVDLAIKEYDKIKSSDIEFKLPQPNYTVVTLAHISDKYPNYKFSLIMGEDNLKGLHKWRNYEVILKNHDIYVYPRISGEVEETQFKNCKNIHKIDAPIIQISSTLIRNSIKEGKNIKPLVPNSVLKYIESKGFYK